MERNKLSNSDSNFYSSPSDSMYLSSSTHSASSLSDPPIHPDFTYSNMSASDSASLPSSLSWSKQEEDENLEDSLSLHRREDPGDSKVYLSNPSIPQVAKPHYLKPQTQYAEPSNTDFRSETPPSFLQSPAYEEEQPTNEQAFAAIQRQTTTGINPLILAFLAYFFGWFGALVVILFEKKNRFVLIHAFQSLSVGLLVMLFQFIFIWSKTLYGIFWFGYLVFLWFMIARVVMDSPTQRVFKLPQIGNWCEFRAMDRIQSNSAHNQGQFYRL
eukprot:TRINITY_DN1750_c0_g1_i1.p1 TRINITY_DN1750_c0_g1~~TRINITY_DN1750_c0_g1_i1.p1  ORF type:complete len:271 (-),score=72.09 TRINITY_DN1750_c0_g1_i1:26-838(-)